MFKVGSNAFREALGRVGKVVDNSPLHEILGSLLLEVDGDELRLTGSDGQLEIATSCKLKGEAKEAAAIAVKAAKLSNIVQYSPAKDDISFKVEKNAVRLGVGRTKYALSLRDGKQFPKLAAAKKADFEAELASAELATTLKRMLSAISTMTHRVNLAGAFFDFKDKGLTLVATDGHRMVIEEISAKGASEASFILPRKAVAELIRLLDAGAGKKVKLRAERKGESFRQAAFDLGDATLTAQLIPEEYPAYARVIPDSKTNSSSITIDREGLLNSVRQVCAVHDKPGDVIEFIAKDQASSLEIVAKGGSEEDSAELDIGLSGKADAIHCKLNSTYVQDMLTAFQGFDSIDMSFKNGKEKLLFCPHGSKTALKYVVMPVR